MDSENVNIFSGRIFCAITGGGRGIGAAIATGMAAKIGEESVIVLIGRNSSNLATIKNQINTSFPQVKCTVLEMDLSTDCAKKFEVYIQENFNIAKFNHSMLILNAASLGSVHKFVKDDHTHEEIQQYFDLNLTSTFNLTSKFLQGFASCARKTVVNLSSLCALQPFKSWSLYCAGKAARDMLFRVLAEEEPDVRVLNYAPGPVDTEMTQKAASETADQDVKKYFIGALTEKTLLQSETTVAKLIQVLERDRYKSGAHVDFYDELE